MKKYVCTVCGYIAEGEIPAQCPVCKAPASAFVEKTGNTYVTEHVVGIGKAEGVPVWGCGRVYFQKVGLILKIILD